MKTYKQFRREWVLDPSKEMVVEEEIVVAYKRYLDPVIKVLQAYNKHLNKEFFGEVLELDGQDIENFIDKHYLEK